LNNLKEKIDLINFYSQNRIPFLFYTDYEIKEIQVFPLSDIPNDVKYEVNGSGNIDGTTVLPPDFLWKVHPISKTVYKKGFDKVMEEIQYGNSFLLNLTYPSSIETDLSLEQIFEHSKARYKLFIQDQFTCFSPESFIKIKDDVISSYPMKGTIDATLPNASDIIINDPKELAEHYTIVDLIRNDLSQVAKKVTVEKFRYFDKISTNDKELLQVSSKITGLLSDNYKNNLGDVLFKLLPAGSICGAPKPKTLQIIKEAEIKSRGYYTGVMGVYDGSSLDCGVMIRAISMTENKMYYHSGGGITHKSILDEEYKELIDKIYVPIIRDDQNSGWRNKKSILSPTKI